MRLLDRYLLAEWLKAFGLALAAMLAVLLLQDLYSNLGDLLANGAHLKEVLGYYAKLLPGFLPTVVPLSQLVSLLFVLGNLHRHNEIVAMRSAGISLWRIARPLWLGGAVLTAMLCWLNAGLVPWSVEQARNFRNNLRYTHDEKTGHSDTAGLVPDLVYRNNIERRHWYFDSFQDRTYLGTGIKVYELDEQGHDVRHLDARSGYFNEITGDWVLENGFELLFDPVSNQPARKLPFEKREFKELSDSPSMMLSLNQRPGDLSLGELHAVLAAVPPAENPAMSAYAVSYFGILAEPFVCLIIVGLAVPFAVAGVRVNPMVGVSKSVGLFFAYYVVSTLSTHLGNQRVLPALVAAWLPIAVMLAVATWFFARAE